jgi:hypothetical protein
MTIMMLAGFLFIYFFRTAVVVILLAQAPLIALSSAIRLAVLAALCLFWLFLAF